MGSYINFFCIDPWHIAKQASYGYLKGIGLHFFSIDPWHIAKQASYGYLKGIGLHFFSIDPLPHFKSKLPLTFTI